jgi:hypothetical protein
MSSDLKKVNKLKKKILDVIIHLGTRKLVERLIKKN